MLRGRIIIIVVAVGFLFTVGAFYPGLLSGDSLAQLTEARTGIFSDWHPPIMSELWRLLDRVWPGPAAMLILQALFFWTGLGALVWFAGASAWAMAIGFVPPIFGLLGTIWKDVGMGAALLFATASLFRAERLRGRRRLGALGAATLALLYATAVRHNAVTATFPLCLWAGWIFSTDLPEHRHWHQPWLGMTAGLTHFALVAMAALGLNFALTSRETFPVQQILLHDLTALSLDRHEILVPDAASSADIFSVIDLSPLYSTSEVVPLYCCGTDRKHFPMLTDPRKVDALWKAWEDEVPRHPGFYLRHRFRVFQQLLGLKREQVCLPYQGDTDNNSLGVEPPRSGLYALVTGYLWIFRNSILFRGWLYWVLSWGAVGVLAGRCVLARRWPRRSEFGAWAVAWSGALYIGALFFIAPTCDFRMIWWTALSVLIFPLALERSERLRLRYFFWPDLRSLVTVEIPGAQAPGRRRLCVFAHFDSANRVSEAVVFYLRSLGELGLEVHFVSTNESLPSEEVAKVLPYCTKVILRKNVGIDFGSWRVALDRVDLSSYDQLVLANDSVFGPLQPLGPIFTQMEGHDLWGLTENREGGTLHLQSYFLVFGAKALRSEEFRRFWARFRFYLRKSSYIRHYEIGLSRMARAAGWNIGAFLSAQRVTEQALADPEFAQYRWHLEQGKALNPTLFLWDVLIRDLGFPFLKVELPKLNRLKMANIVGWRKVIAAVSDYDPELIERALERRGRRHAVPLARPHENR